VKQARLDEAFLEKQKKKLQALRAQILSTQQGETREEAGVNAEVQVQAHEAEDDAQRLTALELEGNLAAFADTPRGLPGSTRYARGTEVARRRALTDPPE